MLDLNCIFCKVITGKVHARIIGQTERAIAFLDAFPLAAGHTLVIPKSHYSKIQDMNRQYSSATFDLLWQISSAVEKAVGFTATIIAIHNGKEAGQEIPHVHIHIIPRHTNDGAGPVHSMFKNRSIFSSEEMDSILNKIKSSCRIFL
jgi:histidine triad (HIT) family protein